MNEKILWYIADPMCSWCWGFMPVMERIHDTYRGRLRLEIVVGGLRPGTKEPMPAGQRDEILHHWHTVHRTTGQPFRFEGALREGFIYDTEPACRAIVAAGMVDRDTAFALFGAIQSAFYAGQHDVTDPAVLTDLAVEVELDAARFRQLFTSDEVKIKTTEQFGQAQRWGVRGFPTVIGQSRKNDTLLTAGYCSFEIFQSRLDAWLEKA